MRDSDASRAAAFRAVWGLIAHGGLEAVTFRRVAEAAGVSVGRIQHHFGTREELVRASCAAMIDGAEAAYDALPADPLQRLRFVVMHAVPDTRAARVGTSVWFSYLAKSADDPQIGRLLAETKRGTEDEVARLLGRAAAQGSVRPVPEPELTARRLLALADGLTLRVLVGDLTGDDARALLEAELTALA